MYIHIYICIYISIYIHIYIYTYIYTDTFIHTYTSLCIHIHTYTFVHLFVCMCVSMHMPSRASQQDVRAGPSAHCCRLALDMQPRGTQQSFHFVPAQCIILYYGQASTYRGRTPRRTIASHMHHRSLAAAAPSSPSFYCAPSHCADRWRQFYSACQLRTVCLPRDPESRKEML